MTAAIKAIAGIGGLCTIAPTSYAVYSVWDSNNPTGKKWLENSGYSLEAPKLNQKDAGDNRYSCANRLFKKMKLSGMEPSSTDTTVYGCALILLETIQGDKFSDFGSHIAIRQGNKGWIINVSVSSLGTIEYIYIELSYSENEWTQESWRWSNQGVEGGIKEKLIIKVPGDDTAWFNGPVTNTRSNDPKTVRKFSKAWISNNNGPREWILQGMMIAEGSEDKSQIFCSKETLRTNKCFENMVTNGKARKGTSDFGGVKAEAGTSTETDIPKDKIKEAYTTLSSSRGSWIELSEICGYGDDRNIDTDKQKKLEMFCATVPLRIGTRLLPPPPLPPALPTLNL